MLMMWLVHRQRHFCSGTQWMFEDCKIVALAPHMLNIWNHCQGANAELMESNRQKSDTGEKTDLKKEREKERLKHFNEPPWSIRERNWLLCYSKQTNRVGIYVRHVYMSSKQKLFSCLQIHNKNTILYVNSWFRGAASLKYKRNVM